METHYEVRDEGKTFHFGGVGGKEAALNYRSRTANTTLWQVERESEAEAAVRRMGWMSKVDTTERVTISLTPGGRTLAEILDEHCPPPAPKETQLDWNTGDPIELILAIQLDNGLWLAGLQDGFDYKVKDVSHFRVGRYVIAADAVAARDTLRAMRKFLKSQPK